MEMRRIVTLSLIAALLYAGPAFAQEWGDAAVAQSLIDWLLDNILLIIVTLALIGVLVYAIWDRNIMVGVVGFAAVAIIGGVAASIPDIASTIVGG